MLRKTESGQTLIMALALLAVGGLLVLPVLTNTFTNLNYNQTIECRTLNDYSADAGLQYAICKIYNSPGTYADPESPLSENFTLNGRMVNVNAAYEGGGLYSINSTAYGGDCGKTTIRSFVNLSVGSFSYAVAAKNSISISNSSIDSSPDPGAGDIHSNGDIAITGSLPINGDASCVGVITKGRENILGGIEEGSDAVQFPSVYALLYETMAKEGDTHDGDLILDSGQHSLGPIYITGELTIKPGATVTLEGPVYVVGDIKINSGRLDGYEHVLSEGNIDITGGGYGSENIPVIISINGYIDLVGPVVDAVIYAPMGQARAQNLLLYGAIGGNDIIVSSAILIYAESLHGRTDLPGSELYPLTYSYD